MIDEVNLTLPMDEVVDLAGLIFDRKLCFCSRTENMSCKALQMLGFVTRICYLY